MKNLKRILSLALASVMVMGMMVVGASAADFSDKDQIDHTEAVETLVALGVISGKENNRFDPKGNLTRAEMATIIAVIRNKGIAPKFGTKPTPTYSDIKGHWAESYIEYCSSFGIVGGIGGGKFDPEGTLTSTQAARMILNAMGYGIEDPSNWALLTEVQARDEDINIYAGIDEEIADPTNTAITRDQMAQMTYNALYANMADAEIVKATVYTLNVTADASADDDQKATAAALNGTKYPTATDAKAIAESYDGVKPLGTAGAKITYSITPDTVDNTEKFGGKYLGLAHETGNMTSVKYDAANKTYTTIIGGEVYDAEADYSNLMGQNVKVLLKKNASGVVTKVYGVTENKGGVLFTATVGDLPTTAVPANKTIRVNGKSYKVDDTTPKLVAFNTSTAGSTLGGAYTENDAFTVKGIDTKGDGKLDTLIYTPVVVTEITGMASKSVSVKDSVTVGATSKKQLAINGEADEITLYAGAAKGDKIVILEGANSISDVAEASEAELMTDVAATAYRGSDEVRVNGTWYTVINAADFNELKKMTKNATYDLVMLNGYIVAQSPASVAAATTKDLLVLTEIAERDTSGTLVTSREVRAFFVKDGTTAIVKVAADVGDTLETGVLYSYSVKDNVYTLTETQLSDTGYDGVTSVETGFTAAVGKTPAKINGEMIDDDAVVVVFYGAEGKEKISIVPAKDVKGWSTDFGETTGNVAFYNTVNGMNYVKLALLVSTATKLPGASGQDGNYGYVLSTPFTDSNGLNYTIWHNGEEIDVIDETKTAPSVGDIISYTDKGNGKIARDATFVQPTKAAMTGFALDHSSINLLDATATAKKGQIVDDDTTIIYIDSAAGQGGDEVAWQIADEKDEVAGTYIPNVLVTLGASNHVDILVIDVNNAMDGEAAINNSAKVTLANWPEPAPSNWKDMVVTYRGMSYTAGAEFYVEKGDTVTVQATAIGDENDGAKGFAIGGQTLASKTGDETFTANEVYTLDITVSSDVTLTFAQNA